MIDMQTVIENPLDKVFSRWAEAIETVVGKGNYSMSSSRTIFNSDKYARIFMMGNPTRSTDLTGNETSSLLSFQVDSFAKGDYGIKIAYDIDAVSHQVFLSLGFRRSFGPEELEDIDNNVARVTSRYNRIYTGQLLGE